MTRVYCIEKIVFFGDSNQISEFHYVMFHGEAERLGAKKFTPEAYGFGRGASLPLSITRPGNDIPAVCKPQSNMVINAELASRLRKVGNIKLLPVTFAKLFEINYEKGDMSWCDQGAAPQDPTKFALTTRDERSKFEPVPECFELLSTRYQDVLGRLDGCSRFRCDVISDDFEEEAEFDVSDELLKQHPVIWNGFTILSETVFAILGPHIDRDFFSVSESQPV